jgi:hypothetical protein
VVISVLLTQRLLEWAQVAQCRIWQLGYECAAELLVARRKGMIWGLPEHRCVGSIGLLKTEHGLQKIATKMQEVDILRLQAQA